MARTGNPASVSDADWPSALARVRLSSAHSSMSHQCRFAQNREAARSLAAARNSGKISRLKPVCLSLSMMVATNRPDASPEIPQAIPPYSNMTKEEFRACRRRQHPRQPPAHSPMIQSTTLPDIKTYSRQTKAAGREKRPPLLPRTSACRTAREFAENLRPTDASTCTASVLRL